MNRLDLVEGGTADQARTGQASGGQAPSEQAIWQEVRAAARAAADKKGEDVLIFDVGPVLGIADAFVLSSGANARHVRTIAEAVEEAVKGCGGDGPRSIEGMSDAAWVLMDFGDFVVNVMDRSAREYYSLERLWGDARIVDWAS